VRAGLLARETDGELVASVGIVAIVSIVAVLWVFPDISRSFFVWGHNFGPAVSEACGRGFGDIASPIPELTDFLNRRRMDFDCARIPADVTPGPLNAYADGIPYFLRGLGLYWRWTRVSWSNLPPLFAVLFAVSNVLVLLLCRTFIGTRWAFAVALAWLFSPGNYYALTYYEHYAKVPIFLACVLLIVSLAWRDAMSARQLFAAAVLGGVLLGLGFGVRADLWLLIVPFVAVLLWPGGAAARPHVRARAAAAGVFVSVCVVTALPAVLTPGRSYFWLQLVEGLAADFDATLSIRPAIYEWIPRYRDELGAVWMRTHANYELERREAPPRGETADGAFPIADWQRQEAGGRAAYIAAMTAFPADFVTRPLAAARVVILESLRSQPAFAAQFASSGPNVFSRTAPVWSAAAGYADGLVPAVAAAILGLALVRPRQALLLGALVLYITGATAIYFEQRHRWHLYFIAFIAAAACVRFIALWTYRVMVSGHDVVEDVTIPRLFVAPILSLAAIAVVVVAGTRWYQDRRVRSLAEQVLAADAEPIRIERAAAASSPEHVAIARDLVDRFERIAARRDAFEYTDYVRATFARGRCEAPGARIVYEASQPELDFSQPLTLDFHADSRWFTFVFPAYATKIGAAFGYFKGIAVAAASSDCLADLRRIRSPGALPLLISWRLPERWTDLPRHQVIRLGSGSR